VKTLLRAAGLLALLLMAAGPARALDNSDCFACHSDKELTKTNQAGKVVSLFVDEKEYGASIHGKNLCTSCHAEITEVPHPDGYTHKPVACSACHRVESDIYLKSDHGQAVAKGESEAASCKDCHGHSHTLLNYRNPLSPVNHANIPQTCGRCHGNTAEMEKFNLYQRAPVATYDRSVHGVALEKRGVTQAQRSARIVTGRTICTSPPTRPRSFTGRTFPARAASVTITSRTPTSAACTARRLPVAFGTPRFAWIVTANTRFRESKKPVPKFLVRIFRRRAGSVTARNASRAGTSCRRRS
jgi:hypothetical protein